MGARRNKRQGALPRGLWFETLARPAVCLSDSMPPKEKYLPVELDLGSAKARVRIKVRENETAEDMAKRIKGIEVEETRMGAYIKRVNLQDLLKNKDIVVDHLDGDIKSVGKNEQWIQVYVDGGLPVISINGEPVGLGISNFYVGNVGALIIRDEERIEKYARDFSSSDAEAIINASISNKVAVSCPGGVAFAGMRRKVFDVFLLLKEDGVVGFYDGSPETKPLGWKEWVFPEKGINRCPSERMYNIKVEYLVGAHTLENKKRVGFEFYRNDWNNYDCYGGTGRHENLEEQKIENKKIENKIFDAVDFFGEQPKKEIKNEYPVLAQEKNPHPKPKILAGLYTQRANEYVSFDREEKLGGTERMKEEGTGCVEFMNVERWKMPESCEKASRKKKINLPSEFFAKKTKIPLQNSVAEKEGIKKRFELKIAILKEKIQKIKIKNLNIKMVWIRDKAMGAVGRIKNAFLRIKFNLKLGRKLGRPANGVEQAKERLKFGLKNKIDNNKNKKSDKSKKVIILLLLEKWFPKIKRVVGCSS